MAGTLLEIRDLHTHFFTDRGEIPAVDGIDLTIRQGEVLGLVGESGCGKSVTSLSVLRLIPSPPGAITGGQMLFKGEDLVQLKPKEMQRIRGNEISMIFQEPMTSLNPLFTIGEQMRETVRLHRGLRRKEANKLCAELLRQVGIPRAEAILEEYPHRLSGGMRQRVMIAIAISCNPDMLIADEPTTALDVTIQAQILDLLRDLNQSKGMAVMLITHDLGVVAEMCDRVAVMYAGKIVEEGNMRDIFRQPLHPYTRGLLESMPRLNAQRERLYSIPGQVPALRVGLLGCRFADRCSYVMDRCRVSLPPLQPAEQGHSCRCWLYSSEKTKEEAAV